MGFVLDKNGENVVLCPAMIGGADKELVSIYWGLTDYQFWEQARGCLISRTQNPACSPRNQGAA
eukprot:7684577-Ditylum_brightwellii.AAC.1